MNPTDTQDELYYVVRNGRGRISVWPFARPMPAGWVAISDAMSRNRCNETIDLQPVETHQTDSLPVVNLQLSMMFFGDRETDPSGNKYRLLFELAKFADAEGFRSLWLPERHFTKFGCLFPSPAVIHASLAQCTKHLRLCAGSIVAPLNDPIRVAEEWAVLDNLSGGRVELAFASGWHPNDFVLNPSTYTDRGTRMLDAIADVQVLWQGKEIIRPNGAGETTAVRIYPTPLQETLPTWLTAAGNPETFTRAGRMGYGVLTHLFHQDLNQLKKNIQAYRKGRSQSGLDPHQGSIAVTLHTFVANTIDDVLSTAGPAYCEYMRNNLGLLKHLAFSQGQSIDFDNLSEPELDSMLQWLLQKFVGKRSMMGTVESCLSTCEELAAIGVREIICLMDFGPDPDDILGSLDHLRKLNHEAMKITVTSD